MLLQIEKLVLEPLTGDGVHRGEGLVHEEDRGIGSECSGHPDPLAESLRRLTAYAAAGADVLFAPGVRDAGAISAIVDAVQPKPVNVLISSDGGLNVADLEQLGVRRVSVGSALARVAWGAFLRSAREIAGEGSFGGLDGAASFTELNELFSRWT